MNLVVPGQFPDLQYRGTSLALGVLFFAVTVLFWVVPAHAQIAGRTEYTGTESGKIFVEAFKESDATFEKLQEEMINPGPFSFMNVEEGSYTVIAYIDANDNGRLNADEPWVEYGEAVAVPPGDQNIVLDLDNPTPDEDDEMGDDNGCCAVVHGRRATPAAAIILLAMLVFHRRRRSL